MIQSKFKHRLKTVKRQNNPAECLQFRERFKSEGDFVYSAPGGK
jgi:hypothetical protein